MLPLLLLLAVVVSFTDASTEWQRNVSYTKTDWGMDVRIPVTGNATMLVVQAEDYDNDDLRANVTKDPVHGESEWQRMVDMNLDGVLLVDTSGFVGVVTVSLNCMYEWCRVVVNPLVTHELTANVPLEIMLPSTDFGVAYVWQPGPDDVDDTVMNLQVQGEAPDWSDCFYVMGYGRNAALKIVSEMTADYRCDFSSCGYRLVIEDIPADSHTVCYQVQGQWHPRLTVAAVLTRVNDLFQVVRPMESAELTTIEGKGTRGIVVLNSREYPRIKDIRIETTTPDDRYPPVMICSSRLAFSDVFTVSMETLKSPTVSGFDLDRFNANPAVSLSVQEDSYYCVFMSYKDHSGTFKVHVSPILLIEDYLSSFMLNLNNTSDSRDDVVKVDKIRLSRYSPSLQIMTPKEDLLSTLRPESFPCGGPVEACSDACRCSKGLVSNPCDSGECATFGECYGGYYASCVANTSTFEPLLRNIGNIEEENEGTARLVDFGAIADAHPSGVFRNGELAFFAFATPRYNCFGRYVTRKDPVPVAELSPTESRAKRPILAGETQLFFYRVPANFEGRIWFVVLGADVHVRVESERSNFAEIDFEAKRESFWASYACTSGSTGYNWDPKSLDEVVVFSHEVHMSRHYQGFSLVVHGLTDGIVEVVAMDASLNLMIPINHAPVDTFAETINTCAFTGDGACNVHEFGDKDVVCGMVVRTTVTNTPGGTEFVWLHLTMLDDLGFKPVSDGTMEVTVSACRTGQCSAKDRYPSLEQDKLMNWNTYTYAQAHGKHSIPVVIPDKCVGETCDFHVSVILNKDHSCYGVIPFEVSFEDPDNSKYQWVPERCFHGKCELELQGSASFAGVTLPGTNDWHGEVDVALCRGKELVVELCDKQVNKDVCSPMHEQTHRLSRSTPTKRFKLAIGDLAGVSRFVTMDIHGNSEGGNDVEYELTILGDPGASPPTVHGVTVQLLTGSQEARTEVSWPPLDGGDDATVVGWAVMMIDTSKIEAGVDVWTTPCGFRRMETKHWGAVLGKDATRLVLDEEDGNRLLESGHTYTAVVKGEYVVDGHTYEVVYEPTTFVLDGGSSTTDGGTTNMVGVIVGAAVGGVVALVLVVYVVSIRRRLNKSTELLEEHAQQEMSDMSNIVHGRDMEHQLMED